MIKIGKRLDNLKKKERSIWERKHNSHTASKSEQRVTGGGGGVRHYLGPIFRTFCPL